MQIYKMSNEQLANLYKRLERVLLKKGMYFYTHFEGGYDELCREIHKRNRALIYSACMRVLRNNGRLQSTASKMFADAVINEDCGYFASDTMYEIGSYYTKNKYPYFVDLVMSYATI